MEKLKISPIIEIFARSYTKGGGQTINNKDTNSTSHNWHIISNSWHITSNLFVFVFVTMKV